MLVLITILAVTNLAATIAALIIMHRNSSGRTHSTADTTGLTGIHMRMEAAASQQRERLESLERTVAMRLDSLTQAEAQERGRRATSEAQTRQELLAILSDRLERLDLSSTELRKSLMQQHSNLSIELHKSLQVLSESTAEKHTQLAATLAESLDKLRTANAVELERIRTEVGEKLQTRLSEALTRNSQQVEEMAEKTSRRLNEVKESLNGEMEKVRANNEAQLEKMRATVDEKLQSTLERRLGESFKLVSERLEQVQQGLGEMKTLASDVGGLKRVLSNVKSRGTWGEVQLSRQLEDFLSPGQYAENVAIDPHSRERVEFAIVMPGKDDERPLYLPIDSKFPQESYERLLRAQENAQLDDVATSTTELKAALLLQAKIISSKYICHPYSTDFALMYLPTEGLFAEAMRIPGLASEIQQKHRVMVTGPTTLMALLNSLQMGFRTLAIEKRSSEVWKVLEAAKDEFEKYSHVWEKLERQLATAQNTVKNAGVRTRQIRRKLATAELSEHSEETIVTSLVQAAGSESINADSE